MSPTAALPALAVSAFDRLWSELVDVGRDAASGGYRRFAWTAEDFTLREWFAGQAAEHGLDLTSDRVGNQFAWWGDPDADGPGLVIGSHLDSVPDGGAFDGPLGVVSSFAALEALREQGWSPGRPVAVANFLDEEGARFGIACTGSRMLTGALSADRALALTDADGHSMAEAMSRAGHRPESTGPDEEALARIGTFVELHVEQGRGLIDLGSPIAIGTGIWPHGRFRIDLVGRADHAGTTRLEDRQDPMLSLAQMIMECRTAARRHGCVATVGKVDVRPGAVNAIPSQVTAWLDARGADEVAVRAVVAEIEHLVAMEGGRLQEESWTATTHFGGATADRLATLLATAAGPAPKLSTGAGHDAGILAAAGIDTAMLFVRNPIGTSHSPAEFAERDDCLAGVAALAEVVADLAGAP